MIGSGGREHALAWRLLQSGGVERVWCTPGNGGMAQLERAECLAAPQGGMKDVAALAALGERLRPDLTLVGPELPLVSGIADAFARHGLRLVGPSQQAAQLEGSKAFAKEFLLRNSIPTGPLYGIYDSAGDAYSALCAVDWPCVIKADGLAAGKGVLVAANPDEATAFIDRLMVDREFGSAGDRVLLEEALVGPELSYIVLTDGETILPLAPTRDHKRIFDGNRGPNTGGMGAYSADGLLDGELEDRILDTIIRPTLGAMAREGRPYRGFLYAGLMLTTAGPQVLEFNCRMGDPETQAIVMRMDFPLAEALHTVTEGKLGEVAARWKPGASACVVMAAANYPGEPRTGMKIEGLAAAAGVPDSVVFHAGTKLEGGNVWVSGGRVLGVTATGANLAAAVARAYEAVGKISFEGAQYRRDIGASPEAGVSSASRGAGSRN
ncbi:MAG TPA: phosphoribosylamine--glycine ligase [Candidatus Acidoferrales bacterium]|nr:phosphoribosylamine--glycine ligase [Candidatus Acidoferrales bacterium]